MKNQFPIRFLILLFPFLCFSCLSKKKHLAAIDLQKSQSDAVLQQAIEIRDSKLNIANKNINDLELQLAERKGENNILVGLRKELQDQIASLELDIENMSTKSSSTQQNLSATLKKKDTEIAQLNDLIKQVNSTLSQHVSILEQLANELNRDLQYINQDKYELATGQHQVTLNIVNDMIFRSKSVTRLQDSALPLLEKVANVLQKYPSMNIQITGHTNNAPPRRRADVDNWNVSAQYAATIVRLLIDEFDMSPSQIVLAARGEYSPTASNETEEGKKKNQRIEFIIAPRSEDLVRAIRKVID